MTVAQGVAGQGTGWEARGLELLRMEIGFISSPDFEQATGSDGLDVDAVLQQLQDSSAGPRELPAHLRRLCEFQLLNHEQETALFRAMNYLKYCAVQQRASWQLESLAPADVAAVEALLERARLIRDHIIQANVRLVMSVVKKFVTPQLSFDEMLSDGIVTLMQAVEKFDYARGFRFSTYAYRSIARNAYRKASRTGKKETLLLQDLQEWAGQQEQHGSSAIKDQVWSNLRDLTAALLEKLDRREQFIIRNRYALGHRREVRTFQDLANRLGVSKERVRQIEQRAVAKLRTMAARFEADDLFGAAMV
ncbi:MAG: sigma-70 family RNA polymerase sigma factor [Pirellulaceae bacterium]